MPAKKNRLDKEKSPYLLQHKDNPIWWYSWSEEAFEAAKKEDKPIFLSVGYATCHWCHVMEGDSFENEEVAKILNDNFISIKVDREERPDVDAIYMAAVQAMTGHGGWPMSLMLTPDLKPFYGGTFIPRDQFINLLNHVAKSWKTQEKEKILASSKGVLEHLKKISLGELSPDRKKLSPAILNGFLSDRIANFDKEDGGFGNAPKFPSPMGIKTLFRIFKRSKNKQALEMATETLDKMARGGIYDHLGGGFHRYATDKTWLTPHFEKMLYDNALLIGTYTEAYQITKDDQYKFTVQDSINYLFRDMQNKEGGFFAAEDADSEKAEGKFYVWHFSELQKVLSKKEMAAIEKYYGASPNGNFDTGEFSEIEKAAGLKGVHKANILFLNKNEKIPEYNKITELKSAREKLFSIRSKRIRPLLDTKILTSWNGLTISALAKAGRVFDEPSYLEAAQKSAAFIVKHLYKDQKLLRRYAGGEAAIEGTLDDYSFFIDGLLELYQSDFDVKWFDLALSLQKKQDEFFWDKKESGYFDSPIHAKNLIMRPKDFYDNAIPSGNAISALNLLRFADFTYQETYRQKAEQIISYVSSKMEQFPAAFPELISCLDYYLDSSKEIAIVGEKGAKDTQTMLSSLWKPFLPNKIIGFSRPTLGKDHSIPLLKDRPLVGKKATAYICENKICKLPTTDPKKAFDIANGSKPLTVK